VLVVLCSIESLNCSCCTARFAVTWCDFRVSYRLGRNVSSGPLLCAKDSRSAGAETEVKLDRGANQLQGFATLFFAVNLASPAPSPLPSVPLNTSRQPSFQHLQQPQQLKQTTSHHPSCLASPAVPPLRPSAPLSRLLSLALRPSSLLRLARPALSPSPLRTSTLLLPLLPSRPRPQRAVVAVSSARWPALLRKLPHIEAPNHETLTNVSPLTAVSQSVLPSVTPLVVGSAADPAQPPHLSTSLLPRPRTARPP